MISHLEEDILNSYFEYQSFSGKKQSITYQNALIHVFNHLTHHRSQATVIFSKYELDFPELDYIFYCGAQDNQEN
ncbi:hypothetical protein GKC56_08140 [Neisseriaceae bacterium PsAf]|nr:hypothetical protein [Neisseriaceae bacterium PsAf]